MSFSDRLSAGLKRVGNPLMVGIDPRRDALPTSLRPTEESLENWAHAYRDFSRGVIDAVADQVAIVKPQAAFFEELGAAGMAALADTIAYARAAGLLVLLDGKRNDIGSTAAAYAAGYLGPDSSWQADALTVSPYLGNDSLEPFVDAAKQTGSAIFVLVKTSNPGGGRFQDLICDGRPLHQHVADTVEQLALESVGDCGYGAVGAVVGATYPEQLAELRQAMPHAWLLIPGYGAQGGTAADVAAGFDAQGLGAIVNSSRGVIFAYQRAPYDQRFGEARWQDAVHAAAQDAAAELRNAVSG